ncbi:phytosulfokines-like [Magnolia sinica]|uniref:phytosulfokines-like n=1 Tax=Magnolia sinica TaxID=86752 RepID=UPI00265AC7DE|nr:phytosulfokines-like [Magnolia sinica]
MSKNTIVVLSLFLLLSLTYASRPGRVLLNDIPQKTQQEVFDEENMDGGDGCDGVGEEECLMRRTLVAHTDYIYTQKEKKP